MPDGRSPRDARRGGAARVCPPRPHRRDRVGRRHGPVHARSGRARAVRAPARRAGGGLRRSLPRMARRGLLREGHARPARRRVRRPRRRAHRRRPGACPGEGRGRGDRRRHVHRSRGSRPDAGLSCGLGHRRRAIRCRGPSPAAAGLLLVAAEGVRVHGGRPPGRRARAPAPGADSRAGARAPALRRAGAPRRSPTRWRTRPATRTSAAAWARRPAAASASSSAGRRTAGRLDDAIRRAMGRRSR